MIHLHALLAYTPFLDPLPLYDWWLVLLVPLVVAIAVVYKTLKLDALDRLWQEVGRLVVTILAAMAAAAVVLYYITDWL